MPKVGRNDPCPCGSGQKYKKCCLAKEKDAQSSLLQERGERERRVAEEYRTLERSEKAFHRFHDDLVHRHAKDPAARLASLADRVEQSGLDAVWAEYLADLIGDIGCDQPDLAPSALTALDRMQALHPDACDQEQARPALQMARAELSLFAPEADLPAAVRALADAGDWIAVYRLCPAALYHDRLAGMADMLADVDRRLEGEEPGLTELAASFRLAELLTDPATADGPEAIPDPGFEIYPDYTVDVFAALRGELEPDGAFEPGAMSEADLERFVNRATTRFAFDQHRQGRLGPGRSLMVEMGLYGLLFRANRPALDDGTAARQGSPWLPPAEELYERILEAPMTETYEKAATCLALPAWITQAEARAWITAAHASRARARLPDLIRALGEEVNAILVDGALERDLRDCLADQSRRPGKAGGERATRARGNEP